MLAITNKTAGRNIRRRTSGGEDNLGTTILNGFLYAGNKLKKTGEM
jgi:hypothetical protein